MFMKLFLNSNNYYLLNSYFIVQPGPPGSGPYPYNPNAALSYGGIPPPYGVSRP